MKRVILFGGSFNPPHLGHLKLALDSLKFLNASELWFIPTIKSPLKEIELVEFEHRCAMTELMIKPYRKLKVSRIESELDDVSYTFNTVNALLNRYRDVEFIWLIGSDQANKFEKWYKYQELLKLVKFAVYRRDVNDDIDARFIEIESSVIYQSASQDIRDGKVHLAHPRVIQYILDNELYLESIARSMMSLKRFNHTLSVCELALSLASAHNVNLHQVYIAALFHDCAKEWPMDKAKAWLDFIDSDYSKMNQALWHQKVGAAFVKRCLHVQDKVIINAIANHIEGSNNIVSKIIYIADKCERTRKYDSSEFINLAMVNIDKAFTKVKNAQVKWLEKERI
jgi:nicotinate-nucleotide adenylyltransferase